MDREIQLPYGKETLSFHLPEANLAGIYQPQPVAARNDPQEEIRRALAHPLDLPPIHELVKPGEKVVILVDDHTRMTPAALILPLVLEGLHRGGVTRQDVTILITHGTHRLSSEQEVRQKVGEEVYGRYRIEQHQCSDQRSQVFLGLTSRGTPVWLNRLAVEADRRIGIGHIGPSPYAGYSGGCKLLVPGVAALDTINANHSHVVLGFRQHGRVDVPCRLDIEEAAAMLGLDMVIDVILSQEDRLVHALAGTADGVYRQGVPLARQVSEATCPVGADAAVTSAYPYDIDLYQAVRAVEYADAVVRPGGSILLAASCPQGVGGEDFYRLMSAGEKRPEDFLRDVVRRNGPVTFSVLGYTLARIKAEKTLYILCENIPRADLEAMGFHPARSLQAGVDELLRQYGPQASLAVFPHGSSTCPVVSGH